MSAQTFAVIIPTFNSGRTLERCLSSVTSEFPAPDEIVLIDDSRTSDDTRIIAARCGVRVVISPAGMAESRNEGTQTTGADVLIHIDSDMQVVPGLRAKLCALLQEGYDALTLPERSIGEGRWIAARQIDKEVVEETGVGRALRVVRREVWERVGGYNVDLLAGEDADFDRRVRSSGCRVGSVTGPAIIHDDGYIRLFAIARKKYAYGKTLGAYKSVNDTGLYTTADVLTRLIHGVRLAWRKGASVAAAYLVLKLVEFGAGAIGDRLGSHERSNPGDPE